MTPAELLNLLREHRLIPHDTDPKDFPKYILKAWSQHGDELLKRTILLLSSRFSNRVHDNDRKEKMSALELLVDIARRNSDEIKKIPVLFNHGIIKKIESWLGTKYEVLPIERLIHLLRFDEESLNAILTLTALIEDDYFVKRGRFHSGPWYRDDFDLLRSELFVKLATDIFQGKYDQQEMPANLYQEFTSGEQFKLIRLELCRKLDVLLSNEHRNQKNCGVYLYLLALLERKKINMSWIIKHSEVIKGFKTMSTKTMPEHHIYQHYEINWNDPKNLSQLFYLAHLLEKIKILTTHDCLSDFIQGHAECKNKISDQSIKKYIQQQIIFQFIDVPSDMLSISKKISEVAAIDPQIIESAHNLFSDSTFQSFSSWWSKRDNVCRSVKYFLAQIENNNLHADLSQPNIRREYMAQIVTLNLVFKPFVEHMSLSERSLTMFGQKDLATEMRNLGEKLLNQLLTGQSKEFVEYTTNWALSLDLFSKNRNPLSLKQTSTATRIQQLLTAEASSSKKQDTKQFVPTESVSSSSCSSTSTTQPSAPPLEEEKRENQNSQFVSTSTAEVPVPPSEPELNLPSPPVDDEEEELHLPSAPTAGLGRKALTE